ISQGSPRAIRKETNVVCNVLAGIERSAPRTFASSGPKAWSSRLCVMVAAVTVMASASAEGQEPIQLKFGSAVPAISWPNKMGVKPWVDQIEKDSGGTIKFTVYAGAGIVSSRNGYDRLQNGIVDALYGTTADSPGQFLRTDVSSLPFEVNRSIDAST